MWCVLGTIRILLVQQQPQEIINIHTRWGCLFPPVLYKYPTTQPRKITRMLRDPLPYRVTVMLAC